MLRANTRLQTNTLPKEEEALFPRSRQLTFVLQGGAVTAWVPTAAPSILVSRAL